MTGDYKAVVIGGSAGSFQVICEILNGLPKDFPLPIIMCLHRLKNVREGFVEALLTKSKLPVVEPDDKTKIKKGFVYVAPSNYHLYIEITQTFALSTDEMVNYSRPSIDLTLETAASVYRKKLVGIILSGANRDGAVGLKKIKDNGGLTIVQTPSDCKVDTMPTAAMALTEVDYELTSLEILDFLKHLSSIILKKS